MKFKILFLYTMLTGATMLTGFSYAQQQEPDSIVLAYDEYENNFYEALKQKGIENYDKAIQALQKCLVKQGNDAVIYSELGRNYLALKNYAEAEKAFRKATGLEPKNRWYWAGLYDVYYETQDFNKSIPVVVKLTEWRKEYYQEDLVSLYMYTQQYDKAMALITELEETVGKSDKRDLYKLQILSDDKFRKPEKENLEAAIKKNPKDEANYIQLIYLYSNSNQEEKAEEVARRLEKEIPGSDWAQVSLFKFHLNNNDGAKAAESMFKILQSKKIDSKIKHRVLNEFLIFTGTNPSYEKDLEKAITYFEDDKQVNVPKEIGKYYFNKKEYVKSANYLEKSLGNKADDIETAELLLYAYNEGGQYEKLSKKAVYYIDMYPTHARLYYFAGLGANKQKQYNKAKEWLENGIDFLVDDTDLEADINKQLGEAYGGLGDTKKRDTYFSKADKLRNIKKTK